MLDILQQYGKAYLFTDGYVWSGLAVTLWLTLVAVVVGFVCSVPLAVALCSESALLRRPVAVFTYVFRGTPLFVQLLLIYTGLYSLAFVRETPWLASVFREGLYCAMVAFALNTAAYTTEIFAGAIRATRKEEIEAAKAFGMSRWTLMRRIVLPSALRRAIPAYSNEVVYLMHATSLAFVVTVKDVMAVAREVNANTFHAFEAFGIAALLYLCATMALLACFRVAEQQWLAHMRPVRG